MKKLILVLVLAIGVVCVVGCKSTEEKIDLETAKKVKELIRKLKDKDWLVRSLAADKLGSIGDERAVGPLIEALKDQEWRVRFFAAFALGEIGDKKTVGVLIKSLKDEVWGVCSNAAEALKKITGKDFGEDYKKWEEWHEKQGQKQRLKSRNK